MAEPTHTMKNHRLLLAVSVAGLIASTTFVLAQPAFTRPNAPAQNPPPPGNGGNNPGPAVPRPDPTALPGFFGLLDRDDDGLLSAREIAAAPDTLKQLDLNGDGQLTVREIRAALPADPPAGRRGGPGNAGGGPNGPAPRPRAGGPNGGPNGFAGQQ